MHFFSERFLHVLVAFAAVCGVCSAWGVGYDGVGFRRLKKAVTVNDETTMVSKGYATSFEFGSEGTPLTSLADGNYKLQADDPEVVYAEWSGDGSFVSTAALVDGMVNPNHYTSPSGYPNPSTVVEGSTSYPWGEDKDSEEVPKPSKLTHDVALQVEGTVLFTNDLTRCDIGEVANVDFQIRITHPDEPPTFEDEGDASNTIQVCVCAWTNGLEEVEDPSVLEMSAEEFAAANSKVPLYLYCRDKSGNLAWVPVKTDVVTGSWVRVVLVFDYVNWKCRVSIDGSPCVTDNGYSTPEVTPEGTDSATPGSWYTLACLKEDSKTDNQKDSSHADYIPACPQVVKELKISGEAMIDDVVVQKVVLDDFKPYVNPDGSVMTTNFTIVGEEPVAIDMNMFDQYGVTIDEVLEEGPGKFALETESGMTFLQKVEAGIDPRTDEKFEMKTMEQEKVDETTRVTITFPGANETDYYSVEVASTPKGEPVKTVTKADPESSEGITKDGDKKVNKATFTLPSDIGNVRYFRLKAQTPKKAQTPTNPPVESEE